MLAAAVQCSLLNAKLNQPKVGCRKFSPVHFIGSPVDISRDDSFIGSLVSGLHQFTFLNTRDSQQLSL